MTLNILDFEIKRKDENNFGKKVILDTYLWIYRLKSILLNLYIWKKM